MRLEAQLAPASAQASDEFEAIGLLLAILVVLLVLTVTLGAAPLI